MHTTSNSSLSASSLPLGGQSLLSHCVLLVTGTPDRWGYGISLGDSGSNSISVNITTPNFFSLPIAQIIYNLSTNSMFQRTLHHHHRHY
jgi:hypothetical protein